MPSVRACAIARIETLTMCVNVYSSCAFMPVRPIIVARDVSTASARCSTASCAAGASGVPSTRVLSQTMRAASTDPL